MLLHLDQKQVRTERADEHVEVYCAVFVRFLVVSRYKKSDLENESGSFLLGTCCYQFVPD